MSKENTATVYGLDKGAYLINKQPQLINDRHLEYELQRSEMYFKTQKKNILNMSMQMYYFGLS